MVFVPTSPLRMSTTRHDRHTGQSQMDADTCVFGLLVSSEGPTFSSDVRKCCDSAPEPETLQCLLVQEWPPSPAQDLSSVCVLRGTFVVDTNVYRAMQEAAALVSCSCCGKDNVMPSQNQRRAGYDTS